MTKAQCLLLFYSHFFLSIANEDRPNGDSRIVGGFPATLNNTQHQVSNRRFSNIKFTIKCFCSQVSIRILYYDERSFGSGHICGGSLIDNTTGLKKSLTT